MLCRYGSVVCEGGKDVGHKFSVGWMQPAQAGKQLLQCGLRCQDSRQSQWCQYVSDESLAGRVMTMAGRDGLQYS